jgi:hypothetical protein
MHGTGLKKFGLKRNDTGSPRNGILMLKDIEHYFRKKFICVVYDAIHKRFVIKVLCPDIMDVKITNSKKTFRHINDTYLGHPKRKYPYRRLLSFHARCSFRLAREKSWISAQEEESFTPYHDLSDTASVSDI